MEDFLKNFDTNLDEKILVYNYSDLKKSDWGKEKIKKYVKRWCTLGFTEGLGGEIEERTALAMEQLATYFLVKNDDHAFAKEFEVIGFPIIRRIMANTIEKSFTRLNDLDSFKFMTFVEYCKNVDVRELKGKIESRKYYVPIDAEAEICAILGEIFIDKFNGSEKSFKELGDNYIKKKNKEE